MRMGVLSSVIAVQLVISARQRPLDEPCPKGSRWPVTIATEVRGRICTTLIHASP
jgi:hypothetical protein